MIDFIIDGIPVENLRNHVCIANHTSKAALLKAFGKVSKQEDS